VPIARPEFTIGIEEEYLLVDPKTRDLVRDPPQELMARVAAVIGEGQVGPEFLRSQIEVGTKVCDTLNEAQSELSRLRRAVATIAEEYGAAPIAVSTHPFASWRDQLTTDRERYLTLAKDMGTVMRRLVICGMHVHVGVSDNDLRIDLINQLSYFLPHILALSCSSPFWHGMDTGLKSYRRSVFRAPPRTGLPEMFSSWSEYERHVRVLVESDHRDAGCRHLHHPRRRGSRCCRLSLHTRHAVSPAARESALALIRQTADRGEHVAGPTLRHRGGAHRLRKGGAGTLP